MQWWSLNANDEMYDEAYDEVYDEFMMKSVWWNVYDENAEMMMMMLHLHDDRIHLD